eukprot:TRINITY_DN7989_c0_g1_i2.p1 TRINITY_DN7989_c0_g1~~TRINITY_DN7989_c0_g1_i2.p1  ORF type:complete len:227 (+),score=39.61 TRINITY_DN7989_c0_g1_i2:235-915(+)
METFAASVTPTRYEAPRPSRFTPSEVTVQCPICSEDGIPDTRFYFHLIRSHSSKDQQPISASCPLCKTGENIDDLVSHVRSSHGGSLFSSILSLRSDEQPPSQQYDYIARVPNSPAIGIGRGGRYGEIERRKDLSDLLWDYFLQVDCSEPLSFGATAPKTPACSLCGGAFKPTDVRALLSCDHTFHFECVSQVDAVPSCPRCSSHAHHKKTKKNKKHKKRKSITLL